MRLTMRSALVLLVPLGIFVALPAASETKEWDQAAVTALAKQLAAVAGDLRSSVREPSEAHSGRRQRRWRARVFDDLRVAQGSANSLLRQLETGAGREETYPTYRRLRILIRDIAQNAQRGRLTEPTLGKLEAARGPLDQLSPFYAPEVTADEEEAGE